ncbi:MAG: hypothetical protein QOE86_4589 [Solirubrobacteraceae bacterium]|jgi:hypothetical protein|nr:hypothetical protein [Solirubrobacteraceae bacterium]
MTLVSVALGLALPGVAQAAVTRPTVTTKAASNVAQSTAQLNGAVNPNGADTTYFFQIGTTSLYGINSPETAAGKGTKTVNVSAPVDQLAPATTYHFRIVAKNAKGLSKGKDRTFKTQRQPLGLALSPMANPITFNASTTLTGQLSGTGNGGQQVVLQYNAYPYDKGFANAGNPLVTNADGTFSFPLINQTLNTQFRVLMPQKPAVVSPIVSLGVMVGVHTKARPTRVRRGHRVRFSGTIAPAADGQQVVIQRYLHKQWVQVAKTVARHVDGASSSYRRRVKVRHGGRYRVLVNVTDGAHVSNAGRIVRVRLRH